MNVKRGQRKAFGILSMLFECLAMKEEALYKNVQTHIKYFMKKFMIILPHSFTRLQYSHCHVLFSFNSISQKWKKRPVYCFNCLYFLGISQDRVVMLFTTELEIWSHFEGKWLDKKHVVWWNLVTLTKSNQKRLFLHWNYAICILG